MLGAVKWADYQQRVREYDVCFLRVERSVEAYRFDNVLVKIIERELQDRPDIGQELRDSLVEPLDMDNCPKEPSFFSDV